MPEVRQIEVVDTARESVDLSVLLEDLDRLLGALAELPPRDPARANLMQRAFLLWQLELDRGEAIDIERSEDEFSSESFGTIRSGDLGRLIRVMQVHDVTRLRVSDGFSADGFSRFVNLLALPTSHLDEMCEGKFAGRLYTYSSDGIEINDVPRNARQATIDTRTASVTPAAQPFAPKTAWPKIEEDPFEAPAMAMEGEKLRLSLRELDRCDSDVLYENLLDRVLAKAHQLWGDGHREESYRALLVLSGHAADDNATAQQRQRLAHKALENFADSDHVDFLLKRACACESGGVRPTQILLQVAEQAAPAVLDALDAESDADRSRKLSSLLLALGDAAVPVLIQTIARRSGSRLQLAVRLAGELQNPKLVPALASVLLDSGPALRREAGMALVNVGNTEACDVLIKALASENPEVARTAALCLGVLGENQATKPLLTALARTLEERSYRVATGVIRALGQLDNPRHDIISVVRQVFEKAPGDSNGRSDPAELRGAKCAALDLAANRSDPEARDLLMNATRDPDEAVSLKAHEILNQQDLRRPG